MSSVKRIKKSAFLVLWGILAVVSYASFSGGNAQAATPCPALNKHAFVVLDYVAGDGGSRKFSRAQALRSCGALNVQASAVEACSAAVRENVSSAQGACVNIGNN